MTERTEKPAVLPADLAELKKKHPKWQLGAIWTTAASGPDRRRVIAIREGVVLAAWDVGDLVAQIRREEA